MFKLLVCLLCAVGTAMILLDLRQQRLYLAYTTSHLHNQIENTQAQLWNQQLSIAVNTSPGAIAQTARGQDLKLAAPATTQPAAMQNRSWADDPNASE